MLVLTRRVGEAIVIGNGMVVRVLEVRGDQVRLGVDAPRSVPVHREEVYREVENTNADAAASAARAAAMLRGRPARPAGTTPPARMPRPDRPSPQP
jgi:carbon storage regulator